MKLIDLSAVSDSVGMPVKSGTVIHLQNAYKDAIAEAIKGFIGSGYNPAVMYILQGLVNSGTGLNYNISAGSVFYNGEVFLVDAAVFTASVTQVAVCKIVTTFYTGPESDGVEFTDGIVRNVHQIRKIVISADLGGSGISNYSDAVKINVNIPQVNIMAGAGIGVTGAYPNLTVANTSPNTNRVRAWGHFVIGDLNVTPSDANCNLLAGSTSGLSAYRYNFPAALPDTSFIPFVAICNNGHSDWAGFNHNFTCSLERGAYDTGGFYFAISTTNSGATQELEVAYWLLDTR